MYFEATITTADMQLIGQLITALQLHVINFNLVSRYFLIVMAFSLRTTRHNIEIRIKSVKGNIDKYWQFI